MLHYYLENAIGDLKSLLEITNQDISDIKEANHDAVFSRAKTKDDLISSFENKKAIIDNEISKLIDKHHNRNLEELLGDKEQLLLEDLKELLRELKERNKHFARLVLAVSEFYNSLLERIIPTEQQTSYNKQKRRSSSFLQVNA